MYFLVHSQKYMGMYLKISYGTGGWVIGGCLPCIRPGLIPSHLDLDLDDLEPSHYRKTTRPDVEPPLCSVTRLS